MAEQERNGAFIIRALKKAMIVYQPFTVAVVRRADGINAAEPDEFRTLKIVGNQRAADVGISVEAIRL